MDEIIFSLRFDVEDVWFVELYYIEDFCFGIEEFCIKLEDVRSGRFFELYIDYDFFVEIE